MFINELPTVCTQHVPERVNLFNVPEYGIRQTLHASFKTWEICNDVVFTDMVSTFVGSFREQFIFDFVYNNSFLHYDLFLIIMLNNYTGILPNFTKYFVEIIIILKLLIEMNIFIKNFVINVSPLFKRYFNEYHKNYEKKTTNFFPISKNSNRYI